MKFWIVLVGALLGSCGVTAQVLTVLDGETALPLEAAVVASAEAKHSLLTDAEGKVDIAAFEGDSAIQIRFLGYESRILSYEALQTLDFGVELQSKEVSLDEIVVSATRWSQSRQKIPARITKISTNSVQLQAPQTAADLLGVSGEVFVQKSQLGGGSPMIRGFSTNRLLYTVDGVRMNTAIFRSGNLQNIISLDPFAIENTEVLFGPGSVIYGSDAIGAVMSFQTLTPQLAVNKSPFTTGKAYARYSTANDEKTAHFDINVGGKQWAILTSFSANEYGDLRMGTNGPEAYLRPFYVRRIDSMDVVVANEDPLVQTPTGYTQLNLMQKLRYKPNTDWDLQYGFHYSTTSDVPRYDRLIQVENGMPRSAEWKYGPQVWMMNHLSITHSKPQQWYDQMRIRFAHQFFEESRIDRGFQENDRRTRVEKVDAFSLNLDWFKKLNPISRMYYGLESVVNKVRSTGRAENMLTGNQFAVPSRYPQSLWASYAGYFTYEWDMTKAWLLQAGIRYNQFALDADFDNNLEFFPFPMESASINNGALTGSIGVVYHSISNWTLRGNLSTGFRSPNVDDVGKVFDSAPGLVVVPNPDLQAEYAYNAELGIAKVWSDRVKVDITAFYTLLDNAMVRRNFMLHGRDSILYDGTLSQVQAIQNTATAHVYGIQAGWEIKLPVGLSFSTRLNYQVGEEELDDGSTSPSRHAAPFFGVSLITFRKDLLDLQASVNFSGARRFRDLAFEERDKAYIYAIDANGNPYSPGWYTLNLKALYQVSSKLSITAGLENLTDQRYRPYSSGIVAPGRNLIMAAQVAF